VALGLKARTQILATQSGTTVTFALYRLEEAPVGTSTGTWMPIESYTVDSHVLAKQYAPDVGDMTMPGRVTNWNAFVSRCRPDGTCDAMTLFFESATPGPNCELPGQSMYEQCARISIMPLGGAITTRADWN
jgi:hypothetical protein